MSFTHKIEQHWSRGSASHQDSNDYTGASQVSIAEIVADSSDDKEVALTLDVSEIKALFVLSSVDMLLETNDGGSAADSISLLAGVPLVWYADSYHDNPFGTDITALFLTTGSVGEGTFKLEVLFDPTP